MTDLWELIDTGLENGGHLLAAGEMSVIRAVRTLSLPATEAYSRLTMRVPQPFRDSEFSAEIVTEWLESGLIDRLVPWRWRAEACIVAELREACASLGLPAGGKRDDLLARLADRRGWSDVRWFRLLHLDLIRRLERLTFLDLYRDRSQWVLERMGRRRWPEFTPVVGGLFRDRSSFLAWERCVEQRKEWTAETCFSALEAGNFGPEGGLHLRERLIQRVCELAENEESEQGLAWLERLPVDTSIRRSRWLERHQRPREALAVLRHGRATVSDPSERLALSRSGKRLAKTCGEGWAPDVPLASAIKRDVTLEWVGVSGGRPVYGEGVPVEEAVARMFRDAGRTVLRAEGALWTTVFALLFSEAYFLPIPGMLPVRCLTGPLDVGTPAFATRRRADVERIGAEILGGGGPEKLRKSLERFRGVSLAGVSGAWDEEALVGVVESIGPKGCWAILSEILERGWPAARGLPDLLVLNGPDVRLPRVFPSSVQGLLLIEVKGPTDAMRDDQAVWLDRLVKVKVPVNVWWVRAVSTENR